MREGQRVASLAQQRQQRPAGAARAPRVARSPRRRVIARSAFRCAATRAHRARAEIRSAGKPPPKNNVRSTERRTARSPGAAVAAAARVRTARGGSRSARRGRRSDRRRDATLATLPAAVPSRCRISRSACANGRAAAARQLRQASQPSQAATTARNALDQMAICRRIGAVAIAGAGRSGRSSTEPPERERVHADRPCGDPERRIVGRALQLEGRQIHRRQRLRRVDDLIVDGEPAMPVGQRLDPGRAAFQPNVHALRLRQRGRREPVPADLQEYALRHHIADDVAEGARLLDHRCRLPGKHWSRR